MAKQINLPNNAERPVIVCTDQKVVLFGYTSDSRGSSVHLKRARMAIRFGTTNGLFQLAETGPTKQSKISARADLEARNVHAVLEVKPEAVEAWENAA